MSEKILEVKDLHVSFDTYAGEVQAVRGVSFYVDAGEVLAIVGESGCGKSVSAQTIMKLNPTPPCRIKSGEVNLCNIDIVKAKEKEMQTIRGKIVSMIFQDPMTSLNPTMKVGKQITESIVKHQKIGKKEADNEALRLLKLVQIPNPEMRINQYPHQFSGGMRQRVMIAMALACQPKLLIADEPTTALDVTIQAQIVDLLRDIKNELGTAVILITHDLGVVASLADRINVMYSGRIMESGSSDDIFYKPAHPYTLGLLESLPTITSEKDQELISIPGTPPNLLHPPVGCEFAARCRYAMNVCYEQPSPIFEVNKGHFVSCWRCHPDCPKSKKEGN